MEKVIKEGTDEGALNCPKGQIPCFLEHVFIKGKQSAFFGDCTSQLKADEAIVQVDFAKNYTCQYQDEYVSKLLTGAKNKQHCSLQPFGSKMQLTPQHVTLISL